MPRPSFTKSGYSLTDFFILKSKAAERDPLAMHELGIRYLLGMGVSPDTIESVRWIKRSAEAGNSSASFNYAVFLYNGTGTEWNPFKAFDYFITAAEAGFADAQYAIGIMYLDNLIVARNYSEAEKWLKKSIESGFEKAKEVYGESFARGVFRDTLFALKFGININAGNNLLQNKTEEISYSNLDELSLKAKFSLKEEEKVFKNAEEMLRTAVSLGNPDASLELAKYLLKKNNAVDSTEAAALIFRAVRQGNDIALFSLPLAIGNDARLGAIRQEAKNGSMTANYVLAMMRLNNIERSIAIITAIEILNRNALKGHIPSILEIVYIHLTGEFVSRNIQKASELLKALTKEGNTEALPQLLKLDNEFLKKEKRIPSVLFELAEKGNISAANLIAACYETGFPEEKSLLKAAEYYKKTAVRNNNEGIFGLLRIYDTLRPAEERFVIREE